MKFAKTNHQAERCSLMDILPIFCDIDDFCLLFEPRWQQRLLSDVPRQRQRATTLCLSEVMTIIVLFHSSGYRNFKTFYTQHVLKHLAWAFPRLIVSRSSFGTYSRGTILQPDLYLSLN